MLGPEKHLVVLRPTTFFLNASRDAHPAFFIQIAIEGKVLEQVSPCPTNTPAREHDDHGDFIDLNCGPHWNTASRVCQEAASSVMAITPNNSETRSPFRTLPLM